jgi:hypothetical protein
MPAIKRVDQANELAVTVGDSFMLRWTKIIAISGCVAAVIFFLQLTEMRSGSKDTHDLAVQAKATSDSSRVIAEKGVIQADATSALARESAKQAEFTKQLATAALEQLRVSHELAKTAARQADLSMQANQAALGIMRIDQRPWLTVDRIALSAEPESGKEFYVTYFLKNTGKTPALNEKARHNVLLWNEEPPMTRFDEPPTETRSGSLMNISPGSTSRWHRTEPWAPPEASVDAYRDKKTVVYVHATIWYQDTFGVRYWTKLCAYHAYGTPLDEVVFCRNGNDVDHN